MGTAVEALLNLNVKQINCLISAMSGVIFSSGWWIIIDANSIYPEFFEQHKIYHLPGVFATFSMIIINSIPTSFLQDTVYYSNTKLRRFIFTIVLFLCFLCSFGALIGASYILVNDFWLQHIQQWPGWAIFLQNFLIFTTNMTLKFGIRPADFF